ncbi:MAG: DEAD/DEAH box helicase [Chloroflexi bacterium]|nr:DEAD/DEAH box helicase [Chloroflexota bacterium]
MAFRPASEGGDSSILPGRRRPPPGARTTPRVLVTGKRNLPVFDDVDGDDSPPEPEEAQEAIAEPAADETAGDEAGASGGRRRRGRRGGRGRRRGGEAAAEDAAPSTNGSGAGTPAATNAEDASDEDADLELPEAFAALGISERSLTAVARMGFEQPTPVQERAIPVLLEGRDVVGIAQTGTGKTLAFGIPMAEALHPEQGDVQGLVLVPTRELAQQVLSVLADLARPFGMQAIGLLGGHALEGDFRALEQRPQIVVGTPGRIKDHLRRGTLSLRQVRLAVLDEADQMLDIGFLPDITHILGRTPRSRQTALFSATMPHTVTRLIRRYMENPERVAVASDLETVESIEHVYFEVAQRDKVNGLSELIERELRGRTLVFSRTKRGVDYVARELQNRGVNVGALHGDLDQRRRDRMVRRFRNGELDILIATNVAARGIDIPEITHVVNYDVPDNAEEYVHRTGRTGRAGREGKAITFASEMDLDRFDVLRETFGDRLRKERLDLYV